MKALLQLPGAAQMQMSKGIWLQRRARGGSALLAQAAGGGGHLAKGYGFKHVAAPTAPGRKGADCSNYSEPHAPESP